MGNCWRVSGLRRLGPLCLMEGGEGAGSEGAPPRRGRRMCISIIASRNVSRGASGERGLWLCVIRNGFGM